MVHRAFRFTSIERTKGDYSWNRYSTVQKFHRKEIKQTFPEGGPEWIVETPNYVKNYNSNNIYHAINVWAEYKTSFNDVHNISVMGGGITKRRRLMLILHIP